MLLIDLENNSPYQITFYNFCKKCLDNNPYINLLVFHNIGNNHYDEEFYKNIKNNQKINIPNLSQILYENTEEKIEVNINSIINSFFDCSKFMLYEGYDNNNNLIYFNASLEKLQEQELNRIFLNENKIYLLNLKYENIQVKYTRNDDHLIIKNNNKMLEQYVYYKPLKFFSQLINSKNVKKLTISGYNYKISEINNPKINIFSINTLNSFSINNCICKKDEFYNNIFDEFINAKYLIISGYLDELAKYITIKNLKKIKFYSKDYDETKIKNIEKKCKKKNIILEIIDTKKNNKYEIEEDVEKEYFDKENNVEEKNKNINKPKPKIIKEKKLINKVFKSDILIEEEYRKFLLKFFTKKYNFQRIYYAWSSNSDTIYNFYYYLRHIEKFLMIIETKEGNIFGCFIDKNNKDNNFIFNILTEELIYDNKLEMECQYYGSNQKIFIKNHFFWSIIFFILIIINIFQTN